MRRFALIAVVVVCAGCQALVGQESIQVDELIKMLTTRTAHDKMVLEELNGAGCMGVTAAYPAVGHAKIALTWGEPDDRVLKSCFPP